MATFAVAVTGCGAVLGGGPGIVFAGYGPPPPTVTSVTPTSGWKGTSVTITGTGFSGVTGVHFGATTVGTFFVNSTTSINVAAPPGNGTVDVTVTTSAGTSAATAADQYTYPTPGPPTDLAWTPANGGVALSWQPPASPGTAPTTEYVVRVSPVTNNRRPKPTASPITQTLGAATLSSAATGLVEDCHQTYQISVAAHNQHGNGAAAVSAPFRPSGILRQGAEPPYVVIVVDGIRSHQPGFTMDPYLPNDTVPWSYCPESFDPATKKYHENFGSPPGGPSGFFHKWDFGEIESNGTPKPGKNESEPREDGSVAGPATHSFLLDALAAEGAVVLPYSYREAKLAAGQGGADPTFVFPAYTENDSFPEAGFGPTIQEDADTLAHEVASIESVWPAAPIVIVGHSQGGLIAWEWSKAFVGPNVRHVFTLDSPINGVSVSILHGTVRSYPNWEERETEDPRWLSTGYNHEVSFVGTYDDPVELGPFHAYGSGPETLEHQLMFPYSSTLHEPQVRADCGDPFAEAGSCPIAAEDHISECPILWQTESPWVTHTDPDWEQKSGHFVVKYCPGVVRYFNETLGLTNY